MLSSSEYAAYQFYAFIVVVVIIIIIKFYESNIYVRPGLATSKSRIAFKFQNSSVLGIIPMAQQSTAFYCGSGHFVQLCVAYLLLNALMRGKKSTVKKHLPHHLFISASSLPCLTMHV